MSKATRSSPQAASYRDDPDAISLQTASDDFEYHDAPDAFGLPPSYADSEASGPSATLPTIRHVTPPTTRTNHDAPTFVNGKPVICENVTLMNARYDSDPVFLEENVRAYAEAPPVPLVYIMGTHRETVRNGDKKESRETTDFRIVINIQRYLQKNFDGRDSSSMHLVTIANGEKSHRGTIMKARAPGVKRDIEDDAPRATLTEWCHRYCASPRMLRIFRLRRVITGFDEIRLRNQLEGVIRATNYRGHINISFPVEDKNIDMYTSNRINEWRLKKWIRWVFYLTFLWIFTWPYLFFATKRYSVVKAEWPFSVSDALGNRIYTTVSEEQWFEKWHVAIRRLALDRYQGEATEDMMRGIMARPTDPPMPGTMTTGHAGVDNAMGILTQGFHVARALQGGDSLGRRLQGGWGYDY